MLTFTPLPISFSLYVDIQFYFSISKSTSQSTSHVTSLIPSIFHWILSRSFAFARIHIVSRDSPRTPSDSSRFHAIRLLHPIYCHQQSNISISHTHDILVTPPIIIAPTV